MHAFKSKLRGSKLIILSLLSLFSLILLTAYDWPQFNGDASHSGSNYEETAITPANVSRLKLLYQVSLPGVADGAPVYLSHASTPAGSKNLLFMTTRQGHILAVEAESGSIVWSHQVPAGNCQDSASTPCFTTSSPVIDPNLKFVYSYGLDGYVHKYQVGDGTEITGAGWPELITLKSSQEKGSSALAIATAHNGTPYLYVTSAAYPGDLGDYQGHLTTINLMDGSQKIFNALCSQQGVHFVQAPGSPDCSERQAGIWGRSGVTYDPDTDRIYLATGNGPFEPAEAMWGDSVLALKPDGTGTGGGPVDSYTPADFEHLNADDLDLGSTSPAILPVPAGSRIRHLALQSGKDSLLRLLDLDNLSGRDKPGNVGGEVGTPLSAPQGGMVRTAPAVWVNPADHSTWVFVATDSETGEPPVGLAAFTVKLDQTGNPYLALVWKNPVGGTSPLIANGVLFYAGEKRVTALDPLTGKVLWDSTHLFVIQLWRDTGIHEIHWESPIVANGLLFVPDNRGNLSAYGLDAVDIQTRVGWYLLAGLGILIVGSFVVRRVRRR